VILAGTSISLAAALVGAAGAVRQVVKLTPAEAMRPASPAVYRPLLSERLGLGWLISQAGRMVIRELERKPLRTLFSAGGIAAAIAILVVGRMSQDAFEQVIDVQFQRAWREDLSVTFYEPVPHRAIGELGHLPGVQRAEGMRTLGVRAQVGSMMRDVALLGYPDDGELRRVLDRQGRQLSLPAEGALISEQLGKALRIQPGHLVDIKVLEGERRTYPVRVAGLVDDLAGLQIYMRRGALEKMLGETPTANTALLRVDPSHLAEVQRRLNHMPQVAGISSRPAVIRRFREQSGESMFIISAVLTAFARVALSMRSRDLASLRVLGFTRGEISGILLSELAMQVLIALPLGIVLSRWFTAWVVSISHPERFRLPGEVSAQRLAFAVLVAIIAAAVSALLVRHKLDHLNLVAVLKTRE
jgi:putative ABC transport system permease protein